MVRPTDQQGEVTSPSQQRIISPEQRIYDELVEINERLKRIEERLDPRAKRYK